jgi:CubicO group peptidase (beta-lactamase class C family)
MTSTITRREFLGMGLAGFASPLLAACGGDALTQAETDAAAAGAIRAIIQDAMQNRHARAVLVRVTVDDREILTEAYGVSEDGVPATTAMHFRNGAVAIALVATLLLQLVDEGIVELEDKISTWLPDLPNADRVSLRHLAQMTSGYQDYVQDPDFLQANQADPHRVWTPEELLSYAINKPLYFEPGTNWSYAHTNYVILGLALEAITGRSVRDLMQEKVLTPLGLTQTSDPGSSAIPEPVLHAFISDTPGARVYEDATFWDPSWTITRGAVQVMDLHDLHASAIAFGTGVLLSPASHAAQVSTALRGTSTPVEGCTATCVPQTELYAYGLGVPTSGNWVFQNPAFNGYSAIGAYHAASRIAISVVVTYTESAFDEEGNFAGYQHERLCRRISAVLLPQDPMPGGM